MKEHGTLAIIFAQSTICDTDDNNDARRSSRIRNKKLKCQEYSPPSPSNEDNIVNEKTIVSAISKHEKNDNFSQLLDK
jgi:hypothetical protein